VNRRPWLWFVVIIASAIAAALMSLIQIAEPIRVAVALWFLAVCPGMSLLLPLNIKEAYIRLTLAVALSLAIDALAATALLALGAWSPQNILLIVIVISVASIVAQLAWSGYSRPKRSSGVSTQ